MKLRSLKGKSINRTNNLMTGYGRDNSVILLVGIRIK